MSLPSASKIPKYIQLGDDIKSQIQQGLLRPGDRLPTFVEMRAQHGVMPATIEHAYARLEQEGLIVRQRGRGTFVAQPEKRAATGIIGFSGMGFYNQAHPYWLRLVGGIREVASEAGLEILLLKEASAINWAKVDGVIVQETKSAATAEMLRQLPAGMPLVGLMIPVPQHVNVVVDDYQAIQDVMRHVMEQGHRRIAYIIDSNAPRRLSGYRDALRESGIELEESWIRLVSAANEDLDPDYAYLGHQAMERWLQEGWDELGCTVVLTHNDDAALGVICALREAGVRVPQQVSVVGFDGTERRRYFSPPLTSVEVPLHQVGATAMQQLLRQMRGEKVPASTIALPTKLLPGQSVRSLLEPENEGEKRMAGAPFKMLSSQLR